MSAVTVQSSSSAPWFERFQVLLARRRISAALRLLNRVIEDDLPLFDIDQEIAADRRIAWLCRIDLLREAGRLTEALAWACLECELHPENMAAQAVKDELKLLTRFGGREPNQNGGSSLVRRPLIKWHGLAGMRHLRAELERDVIAPLQDPQRYRKYRVPLPNGILLYGPTGCGKTFVARTLARIVGFNFFEIAPSDLASIYVHGGQQKIRELFEKARKAAPAMIFFDEFDALVPRRESSGTHHYDAEVNELLTQLNDCSRDRLLVVAATNLVHKIDPAILRPGRFDKQFFVGPPDYEARVELFRLYLADRPAHGIDYLALGQASERYTPAEIRELVNQAARWALEADVPIELGHLLRAIRERPSRIGPKEAVRRPIGF